MTQQLAPAAAGQDRSIKDLAEENELLLAQLHVVQEELEKYYHKLQEAEQKGRVAAAPVVLPADNSARQIELLAENQKLRLTADLWQQSARVEAQNSVASRLGAMLMQGVGSTGALLALPGKLRAMWKALEQKSPPAELGKDFQKVIETYDAGGPEAVEKLLDSVFISPVMRANAYTALARHLMRFDAAKAVRSARLAWETDPRPYRLKWLAFRVHDADDPAMAEAMLEMLPAGTTMSGSEERQAEDIRYESALVRKRQAQQDPAVKKAKQLVDQIIARLNTELEQGKRNAEELRAQQAAVQKQADAHKREASNLQMQLSALNQQVDARTAECKLLQTRLIAQEKLSEERLTEANNLQAQLAIAKGLAEEQQAESEALRVRAVELETLAEERQREAAVLTIRQIELERLAEEHKGELVRLATQHDVLKTVHQEEIGQLEARQAELQIVAEERLAEAGAAQASLERLAEERKEEILSLQRRQENLQLMLEDRTVEAGAAQTELAAMQAIADERLTEAHALQVQLAAMRGQAAELQALADGRQAEVDTLHVSLSEQEHLAAERTKEIDTLKTSQAEQEFLADERRQELERQAEEIGALKSRRAELKAQVEDRTKEIDALKVQQAATQALAEERKEEAVRLSTLHDGLQKLQQEELRQLATQQQKLLSAVEQQGSSLAEQFAKQTEERIQAQKSHQKLVETSLDKALQQAVSYNGLSEYFTSGTLPAVTGWSQGWAASPDFMLWLVKLLDTNAYDLIIEFGSGVTTLFTAKTLAALAKKDTSAKSAKVAKPAKAVTFEHLEQYFQQTGAMLQEANLGRDIDLLLTPLQEYQAPNGEKYQYYTCQEMLAELSLKYKSAASRILVIVDGPPGKTNKNARYPAFPVVMKHFAPAQIDFLLDDAARKEEAEIVSLWQAACATAGVQHTVVEKQLAKGAVLLSVGATVL